MAVTWSRWSASPSRISGAAEPPRPDAPQGGPVITIKADPYAFDLDPGRAALLIIDMQRDSLEPGGFGAMLGNDVSLLRRTIEPNRRLLGAWRAAGLLTLHTREGHRPDLADLRLAKKLRGH